LATHDRLDVPGPYRQNAHPHLDHPQKHSGALSRGPAGPFYDRTGEYIDSQYCGEEDQPGKS
jgi:hypothetical protein